MASKNSSKPRSVLTTELKIGDIIMSDHFPFCLLRNNVVQYDRLVESAAKGNKNIRTNLSYVDNNRAKSKFVVVDTTNEPGGLAHGVDYSPGYTTFIAQRLSASGKYNPVAGKIAFSSEDFVTHFIKEILLVGKLKRMFV